MPSDFGGFPEPQYTKTPNLLFDALLPVLSGAQLKTLLFIVRKTFGFHRSKEFLPFSIADVQTRTGLSNRAAIDAIDSLLEMGMILRQKRRDSSGHVAVSTYRLRFEGEPMGDESLSEESSLRESLSEESSHELFSAKSSLRTPDYNKVLKETEKKEDTPLPPTGNSASENPTPPGPTLDTPERSYESLDGGDSPDAHQTPWQRNKSIRQVRKDREKAEKAEERRQGRLREAEQREKLKESANARVQDGSRASISLQGVVVGAPPSPSQAPIAPRTPQVMPEEADLWNQIVAHGTKIEAFDWLMDEGKDLRRCREHSKFTAESWQKVCEKAERALVTGECGWITFRWLLKNDNNWWKVMNGEYDNYRPKNGRESKSQKVSSFVERKLQELDAERANRPREEGPKIPA